MVQSPSVTWAHDWSKPTRFLCFVIACCFRPKTLLRICTSRVRPLCNLVLRPLHPLASINCAGVSTVVVVLPRDYATPPDKRAGRAQALARWFARLLTRRSNSFHRLLRHNHTRLLRLTYDRNSLPRIPGRSLRCPLWSAEAMFSDDTCAPLRSQPARSPSSRDAPDPSKKS